MWHLWLIIILMKLDMWVLWVRSKLSMSKKDKQKVLLMIHLCHCQEILTFDFGRLAKACLILLIRVTPSFDITACFNYFVTVLTQVDRLRSFCHAHVDTTTALALLLLIIVMLVQRIVEVASAINRCRPNCCLSLSAWSAVYYCYSQTLPYSTYIRYII